MHIVAKYDYEPFGRIKETTVTTVDNPYTFTGMEWDKETGLYNYRARYYDPGQGRFIGKDPIGFEGGINLYTYVHNNPINRKDPSGLDDFDNAMNDLYNSGLPDGPFPGYVPEGYYCDVLSARISECADVAAITATLSGAGAPADLVIGAVSASNTVLSLYVCGPPGTTAERANLVTSAVSLIPSKFVGKVFNISVTSGDAALTFLRQRGVIK